MEYDKEFAVLADTPTPDAGESTPHSVETDNLLHESGRLQLNTYQSFVRDFMNPRSDHRSLLLVHMTGTGKTISALATATEYVRQYRPSAAQSGVSSIIVIGFSRDVFRRELLAHPEFSFVSMDEVKDLKDLEQHVGDSPESEERYNTRRRHYMRRFAKREVNGIYQFYGYREFVAKVINIADVEAMISQGNAGVHDDTTTFDARVVMQWIESGNVRINTRFIDTLAHSLIICDEVHNLYKSDSLNSYGLAVSLVMDHFFKEQSRENYGSIRTLLLSATPMTSSALEIIPIISLLNGKRLLKTDVFRVVNGVDTLTPAGTSIIKQSISGYISYIMDDNPAEYPSSSFVGDPIDGIGYLRFIKCQPSEYQQKHIRYWETNTDPSDERGANLIKDIILPETADTPHGTIFSKSIPLLSSLDSSQAVYKLNDGTLSSSIFALSKLGFYSSKYAELVRICLQLRGVDQGKIFIYHPFVQGSGVDMIIGILGANGFLLTGDSVGKNALCMHCDKSHHTHTNSGHKFRPVRFTFVNGAISKTAVAKRLAAFNSDSNSTGEELKIIIGSRAMRESHTLKACRHVIICHEPSSISEMVQIIGRAVRKQSHSALPEEMRSVDIRILVTDVNSTNITVSEQESYRLKVLQFSQINIINRLMYDTAIDYLINFRFKQRESPPLIGESFPADEKAFAQYKRALTTAYSDVRNGVSPSGIHTSRFNVFYLESEARLVVMIVKRILLDHQPLLTIAQLREHIRHPPFRIEYNTSLISDEAIAMALQRVCFAQDQLRVLADTKHESLIDTLFDQSPIVKDHDGRDCRIVCIGDRLCSDSYLTIRTTAAILNNDRSIVDSFRKTSRDKISDAVVDMRELADTIAENISACDIIGDIKRAESIEDVVGVLPVKSHIILIEWVIKNAVDVAVHKATFGDVSVLQAIVKFYRDARLIIFVEDLRTTRIYDRYKQFDKDTGSGWWSQSAQKSLAAMPVGHLIGTSIKIIQPGDMSWLTMNSIGSGIDHKHPYGWYMYEERVGGTLNVVLKIRFENDPKARGITMEFLKRTELKEIAHVLKVPMLDNESKREVVRHIEDIAWVRQKKLLPSRIIYQLIDL